MILLFDNVIENASFSSLNESSNYPSTNLADPVLQKRYQSSIDSDTITITFAEEESVSSFFYAFTNAEFIELKLYSNSDGLQHTITDNDPDPDIEAYHFTAVSVDYATIEISTGSDSPYLGGVGLGEGIEFPNPGGSWDEPFQDNSSASRSRAGQSRQDYVAPLLVYGWTFFDIERDNVNLYRAYYRNLGIGKAIYIDPFEDDHVFIQPVYATITQPFTAKKNGRNYNFNLNIQESR